MELLVAAFFRGALGVEGRSRFRFDVCGRARLVGGASSGTSGSSSSATRCVATALLNAAISSLSSHASAFAVFSGMGTKLSVMLVVAGG